MSWVDDMNLHDIRLPMQSGDAAPHSDARVCGGSRVRRAFNITRLFRPGILAVAVAGFLAMGIAAAAAETDSYRAGYRVGCFDGQFAAGRPTYIDRDEERFKAEPDYAAGWSDGQRECYEEAMNSPQTWGSNGR